MKKSFAIAVAAMLAMGSVVTDVAVAGTRVHHGNPSATTAKKVKHAHKSPKKKAPRKAMKRHAAHGAKSHQRHGHRAAAQ